MIYRLHREAVAELAEEPASHRWLAAHLRTSETEMLAVMEELRDLGYVERGEGTVWRLTEAGEAWLNGLDQVRWAIAEGKRRVEAIAPELYLYGNPSRATILARILMLEQLGRVEPGARAGEWEVVGRSWSDAEETAWEERWRSIPAIDW